MASSRSFFARLSAAFLALSIFGAGCTNAPDAATAAASKRVTLTVWGVIDDEDVYDKIFRDFRQVHPFVSIDYHRFRLEEYENELLNGFAEDRGPDIFLVHNTWVGKYLPKIQPMPPSVKVAEQTVVGTVKKEVVYQLVTEPTISIRQFKQSYPDAVVSDMVRTLNVSKDPDKRDFQQRVVAVPMSVDTLGMYYNKDLLNAGGIATAPENWDDFQTAVKKLVKQDDKGNIVQAGAALGTGYNVERAADILSALMMQNGQDMASEDGTPIFNLIPQRFGGLRDQAPSYQALSFYTDFANPGKEVYTWNDKMPNSLDAFIQGRSAFFFGYSYYLPIIKARAPRLNLGISKLPQIQGNPVVNFANYWGWTVAKKSKNGDIAWRLIDFMRRPEENAKFIKEANRPAALREQIPGQLESEDISVFASQVLTSKSWYRGNNPKIVDDAFIALIEEVLANGPETIGISMANARDKISQTISN